MTSALRSRGVMFVIATLVLFASFGFNGLRVVDGDAFSGFQAESDALVINAMRAAADRDDNDFAGFMVSLPDSTGKGASLYRQLPGLPADARGRTPYVSQYGLQSVALSAIARADPADVDVLVERIRMGESLLFAMTLAWALVIALPLLGPAATAAVMMSLACSPWLVLFSRSLYWQPWAAFLPAVATAAVYVSRRQRRLLLAGIVAFGVVLLRELMSYEYGTNIILATGSGIVAVDAVAGRPWKQILWNSARVQAAAGAALAVALGMHLAKLAALAGSWGAAMDAIRERAAARSYGTAASGFAYQTSGPFREFMSSHFPWCSLECQNGAFLGRYLTLPAISIPGIRAVFLPAGAVVVAALILVYLLPRTRLAEPERRAWKWMVLMSLAWSVSWAIAMPHHMLNHLHINAIIWYLPFLPVAFALMARLALRSGPTSARTPA